VLAWWIGAAATFQPLRPAPVRSAPRPYSARATQSSTAGGDTDPQRRRDSDNHRPRKESEP
jgi:hypothetical protein